MNSDQVKGVLKDNDIAGKLQEIGGQIIDSKEQKTKGIDKHISGNAESSYGDAQQAIKNSNKHFFRY